jgi:hypothetical protein
MVDSSCGGTFRLKNEEDAWTLFDNLAENYLHHSSSDRRTPTSKNQKSEIIFEVSHPLDMTTKVDALIRKFDQIMAAGFVCTTAPHIATPQEVCSFYSNPSHQA